MSSTINEISEYIYTHNVTAVQMTRKALNRIKYDSGIPDEQEVTHCCGIPIEILPGTDDIVQFEVIGNG